MRCAPQSAWISVQGTPQTFSLCVLKKWRYRRQPKRDATKPSSVVLSFGGRIRTHTYEPAQRDRFDEPEVAQRVHRHDRVVVELAAVVDAAEARPPQEVVGTEDLEPDVLDALAPS